MSKHPAPEVVAISPTRGLFPHFSGVDQSALLHVVLILWYRLIIGVFSDTCRLSRYCSRQVQVTIYAMLPENIPKFRDLPIKQGAPPGSAWGVFDNNGERDVHGTKNFITREAVVVARQEIQTGESVVLKCLSMRLLNFHS